MTGNGSRPGPPVAQAAAMINMHSAASMYNMHLHDTLGLSPPLLQGSLHSQQQRHSQGVSALCCYWLQAAMQVGRLQVVSTKQHLQAAEAAAQQPGFFVMDATDWKVRWTQAGEWCLNGA